METRNKISLTLIQEAMLSKKQTYLRTYIAIWKMSGWNFISYSYFVNNAQLNLSSKTIKNHITQMQKLGWLNVDVENDRIYFKSQEKILEIMQPEYISVKAAYITFEDISTKNKFNNWLMGAVIAGHSHKSQIPDTYDEEEPQYDRETTLARDTLKDQYLNLSSPTQRKYENRITKEFNYVALGKVKGTETMDVLYEEGLHTFIGYVNKSKQYIKQIANTYFSDVEIGIRRRTAHATNKQEKGANKKRLTTGSDSKYYEKRYIDVNQSTNKHTANTYYRKTKMRNEGGVLWKKMLCFD